MPSRVHETEAIALQSNWKTGKKIPERRSLTNNLDQADQPHCFAIS
jgi:hypothetical protein